MRGPSLQKTALLSFALHLTVFVVALLILRQSSRMVLPTPYTVNLVSPDVLTGNERTVIDVGRESREAKESRETAAPAEIPKKSKKDAAKEKELVERKIASLRQKEKVEKTISDLAAKQKRIDTLARLRKIITLKGRGDKQERSPGKAASAAAGRGGASGDYYAKITREIWQQWVYPDVGKKDIDAVVSVKILKDGTAIPQRMEKSSGNALFDRSAWRAVAKASPLSPPPYEMEIGVRFYP
jgi:colicin import membrane protein